MAEARRDERTVSNTSQPSAPLSDAVIVAVAHLVDDAQCKPYREPSHSEIGFQIQRAGLETADPNAQDGPPVGKEKRVRATLSWALEHDPAAGELLVARLISHLRARGGFRSDSANYVGADAIRNAANAFKTEGYELTEDGELRPLVLDNLSGAALTEALESYVRRAKRGSADAALVTGTGKDLLEATAAHVLVERYASYPEGSNFPMLLGQAFDALDLATPHHPKKPGEPPQKSVERAMYELACTINRLRNKEGTGHGRPWLPSVTDDEAKVAVELMGVIAERLLLALKVRK